MRIIVHTADGRTVSFRGPRQTPSRRAVSTARDANLAEGQTAYSLCGCETCRRAAAVAVGDVMDPPHVPGKSDCQCADCAGGTRDGGGFVARVAYEKLNGDVREERKSFATAQEAKTYAQGRGSHMEFIGATVYSPEGEEIAEYTNM